MHRICSRFATCQIMAPRIQHTVARVCLTRVRPRGTSFAPTSYLHQTTDRKEENDKNHQALQKIPVDAPRHGVLTQTQKTVAVLTGSQFVNNLGFGSVIPVLPLFAAEMGLGPSGVGLILSTSAVSRLALNIPFGRLTDVVGRKPLMIGVGAHARAHSQQQKSIHTSCFPLILVCGKTGPTYDCCRLFRYWNGPHTSW